MDRHKGDTVKDERWKGERVKGEGWKGKKAIYFTILFIFNFQLSIVNCFAQQGYVVGYTIEQEDTVYQLTVPPVVIYPMPTFKNEKAKREYKRLVHNFSKTYPYALLAKERLKQMDTEMMSIASEKQRKAYLEQQEKALFKEFEAPLKKLTFSQGKLLMRLIDREAGQTSYYLIKNLKGGLTAFFWQGFARLFGADLKKPYDKYGEDKPVEALVHMYHNGTFETYYWQVMSY